MFFMAWKVMQAEIGWLIIKGLGGRLSPVEFFFFKKYNKWNSRELLVTHKQRYLNKDLYDPPWKYLKIPFKSNQDTNHAVPVCFPTTLPSCRPSGWLNLCRQQLDCLFLQFIFPWFLISVSRCPFFLVHLPALFISIFITLTLSRVHHSNSHWEEMARHTSNTKLLSWCWQRPMWTIFSKVQVTSWDSCRISYDEKCSCRHTRSYRQIVGDS